MSTELEIRERQKDYLMELLELKKENPNNKVNGLDRAVKRAVVRMNQEDIAWVEKIVGVKAID